MAIVLPALKWGAILLGGGAAIDWVMNQLGLGEEDMPTNEDEAQAFLEQYKEQLSSFENNPEFQQVYQQQAQQQAQQAQQPQQGPRRDPNSLQGQANQLIAEGSQVPGMTKRFGGSGSLMPNRPHMDRMAQAQDKIRKAGIQDRNDSRDFDRASVFWDNPQMGNQYGIGALASGKGWEDLDEQSKRRFSDWIKAGRPQNMVPRFDAPAPAPATPTATATPTAAPEAAPAEPADSGFREKVSTFMDDTFGPPTPTTDTGFDSKSTSAPDNVDYVSPYGTGGTQVLPQSDPLSSPGEGPPIVGYSKPGAVEAPKGPEPETVYVDSPADAGFEPLPPLASENLDTSQKKLQELKDYMASDTYKSFDDPEITQTFEAELERLNNEVKNREDVLQATQEAPPEIDRDAIQTVLENTSPPYYGPEDRPETPDTPEGPPQQDQHVRDDNKQTLLDSGLVESIDEAAPTVETPALDRAVEKAEKVAYETTMPNPPKEDFDKPMNPVPAVPPPDLDAPTSVYNPYTDTTDRGLSVNEEIDDQAQIARNTTVRENEERAPAPLTPEQRQEERLMRQRRVDENNARQDWKNNAPQKVNISDAQKKAMNWDKYDDVTKAKLEQGWQWVGDKDGLRLVPPQRAHDFGRKHGLKGRDISKSDKPFGLTHKEFEGGMVQQKFGRGGVSLDHDYTHRKDNPFVSDAERADHNNYVNTTLGKESMRVNQPNNFADRVGRGAKFTPQMKQGTVEVAKGSTNFDQPNTKRIGDIPTPQTDRAMKDFDNLSDEEKLRVANSFRGRRGEAPIRV